MKRRYPSYVESDADSVGETPSHWPTVRVGDIAALINGYPFDSKDFDPSIGIPLVRIRDLYTDSTEVMWRGAEVPEAVIDDGDIVVGMDGDFNVAWWDRGPALLNQRLCCLRAHPILMFQRFLYYYLPIPLRSLNDITYATTVKHLSSVDVLKFRMPCPPLSEQRTIASVLDHQTSRIDKLITKQELLIERLDEYRTALVTRTVTKGRPPVAAKAAGLDPAPALKDSGVEWLGEVPEHWAITELSRLGSFFKGGGGTKEDETDEGHPCIRYGDLYTRYDYHIRESRSRISPDRTAAYTQLRYGDLLLAGSGETLEEIGKSAVNLLREPAFCGGDVVIFRPDIEFDATFLGYAADCSLSRHQKSCMGRGVTVMHIYSSGLKKLLIPMPPVDEQVQIGVFLGAQSNRIDALRAKAELSIERLQEYRSALVSAAVTGKIDVRDEAPSGVGGGV